VFNHIQKFNLKDLSTSNHEGKRYYNIPSGEKYPSVTTVLGHDESKKKALYEWRQRVGVEEAKKISAYASRRGTKIHTLIEKLLNNEAIDPTKVDPISLSLFAPLQDFLIKNMEEVWALEQPVYSHKLRVAGRTDIIGKICGVPAIIDIKTATRSKKREWITNYFLQCSAYGYCIAELEKVNINNFCILLVNELDNTVDVHWGKCSDYISEFYKLRQACPL
jgi:genome maintenance exonuclease 1